MKTIHELLAEEKTLVLPYQDIERLASACEHMAKHYAGKPGQATFEAIQAAIYKQFPNAIPQPYNFD